MPLHLSGNGVRGNGRKDHARTALLARYRGLLLNMELEDWLHNDSSLDRAY
jgi:hypothetical protein